MYESTVFRDGKAKVFRMSIRFYYEDFVLLNKGRNINLIILNQIVSSSNTEYIQGVLSLLNFFDIYHEFADESSHNLLIEDQNIYKVKIFDYSEDFQPNPNKRTLIYSKDDNNICFITFKPELFCFYEGLKDAAIILDGELTKIV